MSYMPSRQNKSTGAFTLVELLTVIAIIALLAAIGFPALSSMLRRAKDTKCMGHLKMWSSAIQAYAADNNNQIYWSPDRTYRSPDMLQWDDPWASNIGPYAPYFSTNRSRAVDLVSEYRKCPSDRPAAAVGYAFVWPRYDNGSGGLGAPVPKNVPLRMHSLRKPSSFLLMSDAWNRSPSLHIAAGGGPGGIDIRIKPICHGTDGQPVRHGGKAHVLFADFHIGTHTYEDFQRNENEWMVLQGQTAP